MSTKQTQRSVILLTLLLVTITLVSTAIPAYAVPSGPHGRALKSLDNIFDDVATLMPGFGGMYIDGNVLKVYITDIGQKAMAENALGSVFGGERIRVGGVQALKGTYGIHQPHPWYNHMGSVLNMQAVASTDIDENANRLT